LQLSDIRTRGNKLPNRHIWHAVEGFGKTSLAAQAPAPIFAMTQGETGLETLIDAGRLPEIAHFPELHRWQELREAVRALTNQQHEYKTFVLDTLNGAERMCHRFITERDFDSKTDSFLSYGKGPEVSLPEWTMFLADLDKLRETKRMAIICLTHTKVKPFKNPSGPDYDRYTPDMHEKTWGLSHKWADVVLFGNFEAVVMGGAVLSDERKNRKGKATDVECDRMLYCERRTAFDAKNRVGLPASLQISSDSAVQAWADLMIAIKEGRKAQEGVAS
jgi:hypothetical protein